MGKLSKIMEMAGLSTGDVASITGYSKSTISQIKNNKYSESKQAELEGEIVQKLESEGFAADTVFERIRLKKDVFIKTENVKHFEALCDELIDPEGDLTSSIGMVVGRAGRGKSFAAKRYAVMHTDSVYVLYIDGFSLIDVAKEIAYELSGVRPRQFRACVDVIDEATFKRKKLVIIDEADKMPKKYFEMLRGINERCALPIVLVGEENLRKNLESERRLKSRIRDIVAFSGIDVVDIAAFYSAAMGMSLKSDVLEALHKRSSGDFRLVVKDAMSIARILNANEINTVSMEIIKGL